MIVVCAALASVAVPAGATSDRLAAVEDAMDALAHGDVSYRSRVLEFGGAAAREREATPEEARVVLEAARDALSAPPPVAADPIAMVRDVGFGGDVLPLSTGGCDPVETRLLVLSSDFIDPVTTYRVGTEAVVSGACGGPQGPFAEVLLDARPALASCPSCAQSSAQVWLNAPPGTTHVNDFVQAHHHGVGRAFEVTLCWMDWCVTLAIFDGAAVIVELLAEPVDLPVPPMRVP